MVTAPAERERSLETLIEQLSTGRPSDYEILYAGKMARGLRITPYDREILIARRVCEMRGITPPDLSTDHFQLELIPQIPISLRQFEEAIEEQRATSSTDPFRLEKAIQEEQRLRALLNHKPAVFDEQLKSYWQEWLKRINAWGS